MAITSITTLAGLRSRIRFISGINAEEISDDELDLVISISSELDEAQLFGVLHAIAVTQPEVKKYIEDNY